MYARCIISTHKYLVGTPSSSCRCNRTFISRSSITSVWTRPDTHHVHIHRRRRHPLKMAKRTRRVTYYNTYGRIPTGYNVVRIIMGERSMSVPHAAIEALRRARTRAYTSLYA